MAVTGIVSRRVRARTWLAFGVVAEAAVVASVLLGGLVGMLLGVGVALAAIVAVATGARRWAGVHRRPYRILAVALASFVSGHVARAVHGVLAGVAEPVPSPADLLFLAGYTLSAVALVDLLRRRHPRGSASVVAETLVIAVAAAALSWMHLLAPSLTAGARDGLELAVLWIRPLADVVLVSLAARVAVAGGMRWPAWRLAGLALLGLVVGDTLWAVGHLRAPSPPGALVMLGSLSAYAAIGAAVLHPSVARLADRVPDPPARLSRTRFWVLGAASVAVPLSLAVVVLPSDPLVAGPPLLGTVVLFGLVLWRLALLVEALDRAAGRQRLLRDAGAALVGAADDAEIARLAVDTVHDLLGGHSAVRVSLAVGVHPVHAVVAAAGRDAAAVRGVALALDALPDDGAARLAAGSHVSLPTTRSIDVPAADATTDVAVLCVPLGGGVTPRGVLTVTGDAALDEADEDAVIDYASELSLALERAALAADLSRRRGERRFAALVQRTSDVVLIVDASSRTIRYASPSVSALTGHDAAGLVDEPLWGIVEPGDVATLLRPGARGARHALTVVGGDGERRDVEVLADDLSADDDVAGFVLTLRDVSEQVALERQLRHRAFHDDLTGVANRALFLDRLTHALEGRDQRPCAVLFCDLDDFKAVNDGLGHAAGDTVLVETARRLESCVRSEDTVGRVGGDEFAVVVEDCDGPRAERLAERLAEVVAAPLRIGTRDVVTTASIGVALAEGRDADAVLQDADTAMYAAKRAGRHRVAVFDPTGEATADRLALAHELRAAVAEGGLLLHYQPIVALPDGEVIGVEALVRWDHPERGLLAPGAFLGVAERAGLVMAMGRVVLGMACHEAAGWRTSGGRPLDVHVNVSPFQLREGALVADVLASLDASGLPASRLVLELTEEALVETRDEVLDRLVVLRDRGIRVVIDDFGTGYSSLGYLQQLPVDGVKIDRSFVTALEAGEHDLLSGTLDLLGRLRLEAVLEGIETPTQLAAATELGCRVGQGFLLGRPVDAATMASRLEAPDGAAAAANDAR